MNQHPHDRAAPPPQPQPTGNQPHGGHATQGQPGGPRWAHPLPPEGRPNGKAPTAGGVSQGGSQAASVKGRGWWRRNWIGLITIVPMIAAVILVNWKDIYWYVWKSQPLFPVNVSQQQWVNFSGADMRLVEFGQTTDVVGSNNKPIALPAGVTVWKAVLEFKAPDQEAIAGCEIKLEDSEDRLYGRGPNELSSVRGQSFITCTKPTEQSSSEYRTTVLFVTPSGARPVAVQIRWVTQFPRYVRLNVGG